MKPAELLELANDLVHGERRQHYGTPLENHTATGAMWSIYLARKGWTPPNEEAVIDARDVCNLNILQKLTRDAFCPKDDNDVDIVGYVLNKLMVQEDE